VALITLDCKPPNAIVMRAATIAAYLSAVILVGALREASALAWCQLVRNAQPLIRFSGLEPDATNGAGP